MFAERAQKGLNLPSKNASFNKLYHDNPYDQANNKQGFIKLSSADNILSVDLIAAKFNTIRWESFDKSLLLQYPRSRGEMGTCISAANFINRFSRKGLPPINPNEISIVPGVTSALDLLSQILFDSGDFLLCPAPFYYRFLNSFGERGLVHVRLVQSMTAEGMGMELTVDNFQRAYEEAQENMGKVRAIILVNPQNPNGDYWTLDELRPIIEWAVKKDLFILLDEIYDLCVYDEDPKRPFASAIQLFQTKEAKDKLIWLWGMSKSFTLPGLRAAVLSTPNPKIHEAAGRFIMHNQHCLDQFVMRHFLDDHDWFERTFFPENLSRLRQARDRVLKLLDALQIPYIKPRAGCYLLVDFSKYLDKPAIEAERRLSQRFTDNKILLTPGEMLKAPKPGWFRIVFSSVDAVTLEEGLRRIAATLEQCKK